MLSNVLVDRLEFRIVRHDVLAAEVLDFHANVFPNLDCDRPFGEVAVDLVDAGLGEVLVVEPVRIECGAQEHVTFARVNQLPCVVDLRLQLLAVRECVVDDEDIQQGEIRPFHELLECRAGFEYVHMRIDGMQRCEATQLVVLGCGPRRLSASRRSRQVHAAATSNSTVSNETKCFLILQSTHPDHLSFIPRVLSRFYVAITWQALERRLEAELNDSWIRGAGDLSEAAVRNSAVWISEIHVVECIEEFSKFQ